MKTFVWAYFTLVACAIVFGAPALSAPISVNDGVRARVLADAYARKHYGDRANVVSCGNKDVLRSGFVVCYGVAKGEPFEFQCSYQAVSIGCKEIETHK